MINSLWGDDFNLTDNTDEILKKSTSKTKSVSLDKQLASDSLSLEERLSLITENVYKILGKQKHKVVVIKNKEQLHDYIDKAIEAGYLALDTETNNTLDYLNCKLVGPCLYVPGQKQAYVPINHVNPQTGERLSWQITEEEFKFEIVRAILNKVRFIYHNYKFDYQVIKMTCGIEVPAYWDTMVGVKMIDERSIRKKGEAALKGQYIKHFDRKQKKYDIEHLFNAKYVKYAQVDPEVFALYAATDSMMTYKLFKYQEEVFSYPSMQGMYNVFKNIEMPIIKVVADMELEGVGVDFEFAKRLSNKYHKLQEEAEVKVQEEFKKYIPQIEAWKQTPEANEKPKAYATAKQAKAKNAIKTFPYEDKNGRYKLGNSKVEQLEDPLSLDSPVQLAILLFDILKFPEGLGKTVDDTPRGTGANILEILAKDYNFKLGSLLVEKKKYDHLLNTFIDAIPTRVNSYDKKIHTAFNPLGAETGRFSSGKEDKESTEDKFVNLQNVPASSIRCMFCAGEGNVLVGCDMSAAEVRTAVNASRDEQMLKAYNDGKDLYGIIASMIYNKPYDQCLEFYPEGTKIVYEGKEVICGKKEYTNVEGRDRRTTAKRVLLGSIYGRGPGSIAEQTGLSIDEARKVMEDFYSGFPRMAQWMEESRQLATKQGYIRDAFGRVRHLTDAQLPRYEIKSKHFVSTPFLNNKGSNKVDPKIAQNFVTQLETAKSYKETQKIKKAIEEAGYILVDNQSKIAQAHRQSVNMQAQAAAASLIKLDMIEIANNKRLKELGFKLLITVHDECIGSVPSCNKEECKQIMSDIMSNIGSKTNGAMVVPLVCDAAEEPSGLWYASVIEAKINDHFNAYIKGDSNKGIAPMSEEEAYKKVCEEFSEFLPENIYNFLFKGEYLR